MKGLKKYNGREGDARPFGERRKWYGISGVTFLNIYCRIDAKNLSLLQSQSLPGREKFPLRKERLVSSKIYTGAAPGTRFPPYLERSRPQAKKSYLSDQRSKYFYRVASRLEAIPKTSWGARSKRHWGSGQEISRPRAHGAQSPGPLRTVTWLPKGAQTFGSVGPKSARTRRAPAAAARWVMPLSPPI